MQIVVLAAGKGTRLTNHKNGVPKCLVAVGRGHSYLGCQLRALCQNRDHEVLIVGGYGIEHLKTFLEQESFQRVTLVHNPNFEKANLYSLLTVRESLKTDFFIFNADHLYAPQIYQKMFASPKNHITAFCDHDRKLGKDDMKIHLHQGQFKSMAKDLVAWDAGYVGVTFVPRVRHPAYWQACEEVARKLSHHAYVEAVLNHLAGQGEPVSLTDISGSWWTEIDTPHDLARARKILQKEFFG